MALDHLNDYRAKYGELPIYNALPVGANIRDAFVSFMGDVASQMGLGAVSVQGSAEATLNAFFVALDDAIEKKRAASATVTPGPVVEIQNPGDNLPAVYPGPTVDTVEAGGLPLSQNPGSNLPAVYPGPTVDTVEAGGLPPVGEPPAPKLPTTLTDYVPGSGKGPQWVTINTAPKDAEPKPAAFPWAIVLAALAFLGNS